LNGATSTRQFKLAHNPISSSPYSLKSGGKLVHTTSGPQQLITGSSALAATAALLFAAAVSFPSAAPQPAGQPTTAKTKINPASNPANAGHRLPNEKPFKDAW
jgi:hypothetical protein